MGCGERINTELRHPPFSAEEPVTNGAVLHGPNTFGPNGRWFLFTKTVLVIWTITVMVDGILSTPSSSKNDGSIAIPHVFYWAYLTHWTLTMSLFYLVTSWYHTLHSTTSSNLSLQIQRPFGHDSANDTKSLTWFHKLTWMLFVIAAPGEIVVALGYWGLEWDGTAESALVYSNVMVHGVIVAVVLVDGFVLNRIPLRLTHAMFLLLYLSAYLVWTVVYETLDIDNPWTTDDDGNMYDDHLYRALQWQDDLLGTMIAAAQLLFVAVPVAFTVVWGLSLYTFPCGGCQGDHRRYISSGDIGANTTPSVNKDDDHRTVFVEMKTLEQSNNSIFLV